MMMSKANVGEPVEASSPDAACSTWKPRSVSCSATASRSGASSSTSRMCRVAMSVNSLTHLRRAVKRGQAQHSSVLLLTENRLDARQRSSFTLRLSVSACVADNPGFIGCSQRPPESPEAAGVKATYSKASGKLELITYDTNKDGKVDAWSHMDGTRLVSMEIDRDFDGVDRPLGPLLGGRRPREGGVLARERREGRRVGLSGADGQVARIEVATRRDGKVNRVEFYGGGLARAEEDTDGDGKPDKRETYGRRARERGNRHGP